MALAFHACVHCFQNGGGASFLGGPPYGKGVPPQICSSPSGSPLSRSSPNARLESPTVKEGHVGSFKWESVFQEQSALPGTDL